MGHWGLKEGEQLESVCPSDPMDWDEPEKWVVQWATRGEFTTLTHQGGVTSYVDSHHRATAFRRSECQHREVLEGQEQERSR